MSAAIEERIELHCKELKLPGIRASYRELAREALDKGIAPDQFLLSCLEQSADPVGRVACVPGYVELDFPR